MTLRRFTRPALALFAAFLLLSGGCSASEAKRAAREGSKLYDSGDYDAALPLLEKAAQKGLKDGDLYYQLGYIYDRKGRPEKSREFREKALPLLQERSASRDGTLETWYYLTALYANLNRPEEMKKAAAEGIRRFGEAPGLGGEDLFRLGRLYQFAGEGGKGAAAYHRAVEAFEGGEDPNPTFRSLALLADARTDRGSRHYADASRKFQQAAALSPGNAPPPFDLALAHLGAGELDQAKGEFDRVQDPDRSSEAQYGADLARRLKEAGGALDRTPDGKTPMELDNTALEAALRSAAESLRKAREAPASGKGAAGSDRAPERLFFSLAAEWMLRGNPIREAALSGGYADLIRR